jgi:hypothetical protein
MSRIEELKKQNPAFNIDGIAIMNDSLGKSKYTEMAINLIKHKILENNEVVIKTLFMNYKTN